MLTIAKLFGKSPFAALLTHMGKVESCISELPSLFQAVLEQKMDVIEEIGHRISQLEYEADLTKNDIRAHLPKSLFLMVDRGSILEILSLQDTLADQAEKIAHHARMRSVSLLPEMKEEFSALCSKSLEAFWLSNKVVKEIEELIESSFGGIEAQKVKAMVDEIAFCEHQSCTLQNQIKMHLYQRGDDMPYPAFHLCLKLINEIASLASISEKLGDRIRMLLELK